MKRGKILWLQLPLPLPLPPALSTPHFVCYQIQFGVQFSIGITALCVVKFQRQHRLQRQTSSPSPSSTNWVSGLVKKGSETSRWKKKKRRKGNTAQETKEKIKFPRYEKMRRNDKSENKYWIIDTQYIFNTHTLTHTCVTCMYSRHGDTTNWDMWGHIFFWKGSGGSQSAQLELSSFQMQLTICVWQLKT